MDSQLQSISKLFTERLYRIPDYQRGYAWGLKQLKDFWGDISQLEDGKNHYTGVLTLEAVSEQIYNHWFEDKWIIEHKSYDPYFVVDGQQRLTTTVILIQAITEIVTDDVKLNFTSIGEIRKKFIFDSRDEGISRSYVFGYEKDNPSYEFLKNKIFQETSSSGYMGEETIYTLNLEFARNFFLEKLRDLHKDEIEKIYKKITQNLLFNTYTISSDIDVFVAFETMNNRGKPLSNLELLKNRLIYISTKFDVSEDEKETLRRVINNCWKSLYHFLGKNKNKPLDDDLFLVNHFLIYFGKDLVKKKKDDTLYRRVASIYRDKYVEYLLEVKFTTKNITGSNGSKTSENVLTLADVYEYSESLQNNVKLWYDLFNPLQSNNFSNEEKHLIDKLLRIGIQAFLPVLIILYSKKPSQDEAVLVLKLIERAYFVETLLRSSTIPTRLFAGSIDSYNLSLYLCSKRNPILEIKKHYQALIDSYLSDVDKFQKILIDRFENRGFYSWVGIRYFLYEHEQYLKSTSKTSHSKINWDEFNSNYYSSSDFLTVEHIYPQDSSKTCWDIINKRYKLKERNQLVNSLGNLLPLSKPKNSSLRNDCFLEKVDAKDTIGYRYGSFSENQVSKLPEWNADSILNRGLQMLDFMQENWQIPLGDKSVKIQILGLKFMEEKSESQ